MFGKEERSDASYFILEISSQPLVDRLWGSLKPLRVLSHLLSTTPTGLLPPGPSRGGGQRSLWPPRFAHRAERTIVVTLMGEGGSLLKIPFLDSRSKNLEIWGWG